MKKLLYLFLFLINAKTYSQNTFPTSGNAGIGTTSPTSVSGFSVLSFDSYYGGFIDFRHSGAVIGQIWSDQYDTNIWAGTGAPLRLYTDGNEKLTILPNGSTGLGTNTPLSRLEVASSGNTTATGVLHISGGQAWGHVLVLASDNTGGTDDARMLFSYRNKAKQWGVGGSYNSTRFSVWEDAGDATYPSGYGSYGTERFAIAPGGNVGIGTSTPDQKLTVNGTIHSTQVKVDLNVPGPDYVFAKNYHLAGLKSVKSYIENNHHLSEIPTADQMQKEGVNLGELNVKLLKKVEELTLYLINQDKRIVILEKNNNIKRHKKN